MTELTSKAVTRSVNGDSQGLFVIAPTPFNQDGSLDLQSAKTMCDFFIQKGASGLTILGIMGEAPKLTPEESLRFVETVLDHLQGRLPVIVGVSHAGLMSLVDLARQSMDLGASGVMVAPLPSLKTDDAIASYYDQVCQALGPIPVCLQDYPQTLGVHFSVSLLARIFSAHESICMLKHEDCPGLNKLSRFRELCQSQIRRRISVLVGNGGLHLPQELARGADGAMTGFAFPEMLSRVITLFKANQAEAAETLFDAYLPLVRYELQPGLGLAIRKYILAKRGAIACSAVRAPGPTLSQQDVAEIHHLWARQNKRLAEVCPELISQP